MALRLLAAAGGERKLMAQVIWGLVWDGFGFLLFNNAASLPVLAQARLVLLCAAREACVGPTTNAACGTKPSLGTEVACQSPCQKVTVLGEMS